MSYATVDDVKSLFRDFADNAHAAVDTADITSFLDTSSAVINAKVGTLYALPITEIDNPKSFKILKQLQMFEVAAIVDDILNNYGEADKKPGWEKRARELLKSIVPDRNKKGVQPEPILKLQDAEYLGTQTQRGKIKLSSVEGTVIRKNEDNW